MKPPEITIVVSRADGISAKHTLSPEAMAPLMSAGWVELVKARAIDLLAQCGFQAVTPPAPHELSVDSGVSLSIMKRRGSAPGAGYVIFGHTGSVPVEQALTRNEVVAYVQDAMDGKREWPR